MISASISARRTSGFHRRCVHNHDRVAQIRGVMAQRHFDAEASQTFNIGVFRCIRSLNAIAEIVHDFSDAAHAYAADSDEMNRTDIGWDACGDSRDHAASAWAI
jgi:hypothetical protein